MVTQFERFLVKANLAKSTVASYLWTMKYFLDNYKEVNKKNLLAYKGYWRKRSIPTHSGWLYPLTFDAGKGLKEA